MQALYGIKGQKNLMTILSLTREDFLKLFSGVYEHTQWITERTFDLRLHKNCTSAASLAEAMARVMAAGTDAQKLALIKAHPDLAGKLALAALTPDSQSEQQSAGLDRLTHDEHKKFLSLNARYQSRFGFPFIMAVKGRPKDDILIAFETRLSNDVTTERETALHEIDKIARLRIETIFTQIFS